MSVYEELKGIFANDRWDELVDTFKVAEEQGFSCMTVIAREDVDYQVVMEIMARTNWRLSPLLTTGRPYALQDGHVWLLTNEPEPEPVPDVVEDYHFFDRKDPLNWEDVVQVKPEEVKEFLEKGYEYSAKWKGLVELTLFKDPTKKDVELRACHEGVLEENQGILLECQGVMTPLIERCEYCPPDTETCTWYGWTALKLGLDLEAISSMAEAAEALAEKLGINFEEALKQFLSHDVKAIMVDHSDDPLMNVDPQEAYRVHAEKLGKDPSELTEEEKKRAFQEYCIKRLDVQEVES